MVNKTAKSTKKLLVIFFVLILSSFSLAQEGISVPFLLPDSPFYFINTIFEGMQKILAVSPESKSRLAVDFADKRLAEARELSRKGNFSLALNQVQKASEELREAVLFSNSVLVLEEKQELRTRIKISSVFAVSVIEEVREITPSETVLGLDTSIQGILMTIEESQDASVSLVDVSNSKFSLYVGQAESFCNSMNGTWSFSDNKIGCENISGVQCNFGLLGMISNACTEAGAVYSCSNSGVVCERLG